MNRAHRTLRVLLPAVMLVGAVAVIAGPGRAAHATQLVAVSFDGPTNGITEAESRGWDVGGNASAIGNTLPRMVPSVPDGDDDRLRLTDTHMQETGYALYDIAQTTAGGLDVTFNVAMHGYGGTICPASPSDNYNYTSTGGAQANTGTTCQADGFVMYLKDGRDLGTGGSSLGYAGGSLGYSALTASNQSVNGLSGALLGVGLDAYGNFYQRPFSGSDCDNDPPQSAAGEEVYARRSLIVRGPQGATRTTGYCRLSTSEDTTSARNTGVSISSYASLFTASGSAVRVTIDPADTWAGGNGTGTVYLAAAGTTDWTGVTAATKFELPQKLVDAPSFKFGFVGATGGGAMNVDLWGVQVGSLVAVPPPSFSSPPGTLCLVRDAQFRKRLHAADGVAPFTFSVPEQDAAHAPLPEGITLSSTGLLSGTPTTVGDYSTVLAVDDAAPDTATGTVEITLQVRASCDSRVVWSLSGQSPHVPPRAPGDADDGFCQAGEYHQTDDGQYRVVVMSAADGGTVCTWTPPTGVTVVDALVVGGGGGGGADSGGGGGGGGIAHASALPVAGTYTVIAGGGGYGGGFNGSYAQYGGYGGPSRITDSQYDDVLYADGGAPGGNCGYTYGSCYTNTGGQGGSVDGSMVTLSEHRFGGHGGDGTWNASRNPRNDGGMPGQFGLLQQSGLASVEYGCGGGGSGGGLAPGDPGCDNAGAGAAGSGAAGVGVPGTGSGGGGGNTGGGGAGGSGTVILRYALPLATNDPQVTASWAISGTSGTLDAGTAVRQVAGWSATNGCDADWVTQDASATQVPDNLWLPRGHCYRWTLDYYLDSQTVTPTDNDGFSPTVNLTSPPLIVVPDVTMTVPERILVDPRALAVQAPGVVVSDPSDVGHVAVCISESASATLDGVGQSTVAQTVLFGAGPGSITDGAVVTGEGTTHLRVDGTVAQVQDALAGFQVVRPALGATHYDTTVSILFRILPVIDGVTSSCEPGAGGIEPMASGTELMHIVPLDLQTTYHTPVPIGRQ